MFVMITRQNNAIDNMGNTVFHPFYLYPKHCYRKHVCVRLLLPFFLAWSGLLPLFLLFYIFIDFLFYVYTNFHFVYVFDLLFLFSRCSFIKCLSWLFASTAFSLALTFFLLFLVYLPLSFFSVSFSLFLCFFSSIVYLSI